MVAKKIKLAKPVDLGGKMMAEITLKEPSGGLYIKLGDPRVLVFNASGSGYWVEQNEVIKAYLEQLIESEIQLGADVVNLLSLEDTMELKEALFGFFSSAAERRAATK
jgi:hypothetical protein